MPGSLRALVPLRVATLFLGDATLVAASYAGAVYLSTQQDSASGLTIQWPSIAWITGLILVAMYFRNLYSDLRVRSRILLAQELVLVMGLLFIAEALISYGNLGPREPPHILLIGTGIALVSTYSWRLLFSAAIRNRLGVRHVLFVGFSPAVAKTAKRIADNPGLGIAAIGYLDDRKAEWETDVAWLGSPAQLQATAELKRPDWIVVGANVEIAPDQLDNLVELRFGGVEVEDSTAFCETIEGRVSATEIRPAELIFSERLQPRGLNIRLQSMYTTILALLVAPIALPLMAIIALSTWATSRGPVMICEQLAGIHGVTFTARRFRTKALARFGLDRLPQIWNVLRGEMSLVGPEPDRPEFADRLNQVIPFHSQRLLVRPGITGWAQLSQRKDRSAIDALRRLEYDLYYIKNVSPLLDFLIMLRWLREAILFRTPRESA